MKEKRVSLQDIADSVGVSKATVSFVLNGRGDEFNISPKTQQLIKDKAKELLYVPNFFAKSLRQGTTKTIGLVLADITNPFYAELCKTIQEKLHEKGYKTFIVNTNEDLELEKTLMRELIQRSIDGMIISPCNKIEALIPILHETHIPVVFADRPGDDQADFVGVDNEKEAQKLVSSFSKTPGKLVVISPKTEDVETIEKRQEGVKKACNISGIPVTFINDSGDQEALDSKLKKELKDGADSFLSLNNRAVFKTLATLKRLNVKLPEQARLISFDDHEAFSYMDPPVSALRQPVQHIGIESVERMIDRLSEKKTPGKHLLLSCEFIPRGTH